MSSAGSKSASGNGWRNKFRHLTYATPFYNLALMGKPPSRLLGTPPELWPGDPAAGRAILGGTFLVGDLHLRADRPATLPRTQDTAWLAYLHGFSWLSDMRALGSDEARDHARLMIANWIATNDHWSPLLWRSDILGGRLVSWLSHYGFIGADADDAFRKTFFGSLNRQIKHLSRTTVREISGEARIAAIKGLVYAGISVPGKEHLLHPALRQMKTEIDRQILPDGGHVSRSPATLYRVLKHLVDMRLSLMAAHFEVPAWLPDAITLTIPMMRALRHGDGRLALFHGGGLEQADKIDALLLTTGVKTKAASSAPHSGFHRLSAGRSLLIADVGAPPSGQSNPFGHAGTLAFEFSVGKDRLIVNCGSEFANAGAWRQALRATAAHSTAIVDDINAAEIDPDGGFRRTPSNVTVSRREIEGSVILEAAHDGYENPFGLIHRRLLMMGPDGRALQGEDNLIGAGGESYAVRFHLHPTVQATMLQGGDSVLLRLGHGAGWRFTSGDGKLTLEESVFVGAPGQVRRSQQVVISGHLDGSGTTVKWLLGQIGK